jgi:L-ascorbate metabolism protein UlaG (beta-lactamase superfamily)
MKGIEWLGHDSFRITGSATVYIDPWQLSKGAPPADLVLVTHEHGDHFNRSDIASVSTPQTVVIGPAEVTSKLTGAQTLTIAPGETLTVGNVKVMAVPAYNLNKYADPKAGVLFHPREDGKVGYIVELDGRTIYHTGDTDNTPELSDIDVDVALVPVSGTYVMTVDEALEACTRLKAKTVIPMHYATIVGDVADAERFAKECSLPVEVLTKTAP